MRRKKRQFDINENQENEPLLKERRVSQDLTTEAEKTSHFSNLTSAKTNSLAISAENFYKKNDCDDSSVRRSQRKRKPSQKVLTNQESNTSINNQRSNKGINSSSDSIIIHDSSSDESPTVNKTDLTITIEDSSSEESSSNNTDDSDNDFELPYQHKKCTSKLKVRSTKRVLLDDQEGKYVERTTSDEEDEIYGDDDSYYAGSSEESEDDTATTYCSRTKTAVRIKKRVSEQDHHDCCLECKGTNGDLLMCDTCPACFHLQCLNPPLPAVPKGTWSCAYCKCKEFPSKVQLILAWRWADPPTAKVTVHGILQKIVGTRTREFLVKYEGFSYYDVAWVSEIQLYTFQRATLNYYKTKHDMEEPADIFHCDDEENENFKKFYQYGINESYLTVQRIIHERQVKKGGKKEYLVKWLSLPYDQSTWESESRKDIPNLKNAIEKYKKHKSDKTNPKKKKKKKGPSPKKQYETQPQCITDLGLKLHDYQLEGLNWLRFSWSQGNNVILADEMGLGKTIQTIVFIKTLIEEGHSEGPFLVSVPLSTMINWEREFALWAPELYLVSYQGDPETRDALRQYDMSFDEGAFPRGVVPTAMRGGSRVKFHVLLTSYEYCSMDIKTLSSISWESLTVDEGHRLKNENALFFTTMTQYTVNHKLLLSGTPLQNTLTELFNLLHFLCPEKFPDCEDFLEEFAEVGKEEQIKKLHKLLSTHMLRRLKADVLKGLAPKSEMIVCCSMSPVQKELYKFVLTKNFKALNSKTGPVKSYLGNIVMDLRKCVNHPFLFSKPAEEAPRAFGGGYEGSELVKTCGKLVVMQKMMRALKERGHRVLIFSTMTKLLDILEDYLVYEGWGFGRIDGSVKGIDRQMAIDHFNSPYSKQFAFLLSTKAGGLGINLATADTVIIYDADWNPHNDIQAFSRAHRIGQKNKVMIYRFVTRNTIEERIQERCKEKMMLSHLVVRPGMGSNAGCSLSKQELEGILKFGVTALFNGEENDITYDDEAINELLDQRNVVEEAPSEDAIENAPLQDYLSSFKVATYKEATDVRKRDSNVGGASNTNADRGNGDEDWNVLLGRYIEEEEVEEELLGRGQRSRKRVQYYKTKAGKADVADNNSQENLNEDKNDASFNMGSSEEDEESDSGDDEFPPPAPPATAATFSTERSQIVSAMPDKDMNLPSKKQKPSKRTGEKEQQSSESKASKKFNKRFNPQSSDGDLFSKYVVLYTSQRPCGFPFCTLNCKEDHFHCEEPRCRPLMFMNKKDIKSHHQEHQILDQNRSFEIQLKHSTIGSYDCTRGADNKCYQRAVGTHYHCNKIGCSATSSKAEHALAHERTHDVTLCKVTDHKGKSTLIFKTRTVNGRVTYFCAMTGCDFDTDLDKKALSHASYHRGLQEKANMENQFVATKKFTMTEDATCGIEDCVYRISEEEHYHCMQENCTHPHSSVKQVNHAYYHDLYHGILTTNNFKEVEADKCQYTWCNDLAKKLRHIHCTRDSNCRFTLTNTGASVRNDAHSHTMFHDRNAKNSAMGFVEFSSKHMPCSRAVCKEKNYTLTLKHFHCLFCVFATSKQSDVICHIYDEHRQQQIPGFRV